MHEILRHDTGDAHAVVGTVASLQTFGSWFLVWAANFHPHVHALITEGTFHDPRSETPSFEWVAGWDVTAIAELFRRRGTIGGSLSGVLGAGTVAEPRLVSLFVSFKAAEITSNGGSPCSEQQ